MEIPTVDYFDHVSYRTASSCGIPSSPCIAQWEVNSLVIYINNRQLQNSFMKLFILN